ncbi:MAG: hypothetical protein AMJ69_06205 [Gammaproteobacteria bacterium SG8_47]|nr:MAG: hypothetical protein AMJ69_06205 [Gammaproteobacteria bacterium SG8_47]
MNKHVWWLSLVVILLAAFSATMSVAAPTAQEAIEAGNAQWAAGELDAALASYQRAAATDENSVDARLKLAGVRMARKEYRAAVEAFQDAASINPDDAKPFIGMGIAYLHLGQDSLAHAALTEAVRLEPARREQLEPLLTRIEARLDVGTATPSAD